MLDRKEEFWQRNVYNLDTSPQHFMLNQIILLSSSEDEFGHGEGGGNEYKTFTDSGDHETICAKIHAMIVHIRRPPTRTMQFATTSLSPHHGLETSSGRSNRISTKN